MKSAYLDKWDYAQRRKTRKADGLISEKGDSFLVTTFDRHDDHIYGRIVKVAVGTLEDWKGVSYHGDGTDLFPSARSAEDWVRRKGEEARAANRAPLM